MSMLDAFFNKGGTGFKAAKCKTLLKLTIPRIKLLRNRREIQLKQMRKDIAKLLENGQEATARIRVEHIVREENMLAAQEIIELFCELISVRLPIIETQRECPIDLKEAISSICFAAPRCADLTELMQVQMLFGAKYGKEFIAGAAELLPDCGVNRQIIELLSVRAPSAETKMKLLKEIAEEHGLDWDPSATESEFSKRHDDLLNGPSYTTSSNFALPKEEKHEDKSSEEEEENDSELNSEYDSLNLDLPQVPKFTVTSQSNKPPPVQETGPKNIPFLPPNNTPTQTITPNNNDKNIKINNNDDNIPIPFPHAASLDTQFDYINQNEPKQFLPFTSSPSLPTESRPVFKSEIHEELSERKTEIITKPSPMGQYSNVTSSETYQYSDVAPAQYSNVTPPKVQNWNQIPTLDLQDVLSAARAAADTAERAATAARAAADLTQTRISDFNSKHNKNNEIKTNLDEEKVVFDRQDSNESVVFDRQDSDKRAVFDRQDSNSNVFSNVEMESPFSKESHVPQRVNSLEDDPYDYPNLFGSSSRNP